MTKQAYLADAAVLGRDNRAAVSEALHVRLSICLDFAFRFLAPVHICILADALALCLPDQHVALDEVIQALAKAASRSRHLTEEARQALILGSTGNHLLQAERVVQLGVR